MRERESERGQTHLQMVIFFVYVLATCHQNYLALLGIIEVASSRHCRAAAQRGSKQSSCSESSAFPDPGTPCREVSSY